MLGDIHLEKTMFQIFELFDFFVLGKILYEKGKRLWPGVKSRFCIFPKYNLTSSNFVCMHTDQKIKPINQNLVCVVVQGPSLISIYEVQPLLHHLSI